VVIVHFQIKAKQQLALANLLS